MLVLGQSIESLDNIDNIHVHSGLNSVIPQKMLINKKIMPKINSRV